MKLADTVNLMYSNDWRDRFIAEYIQLQIRLSKLDDVLNNRSDTYSVTDDVLKSVMYKQRDAMESYKLCLERRANLANIDLHSYPIKSISNTT